MELESQQRRRPGGNSSTVPIIRRGSKASAADDGGRHVRALAAAADGMYTGKLRTGPYLREEPDETGERGTPIVVWDREITDVLDSGN